MFYVHRAMESLFEIFFFKSRLIRDGLTPVWCLVKCGVLCMVSSVTRIKEEYLYKILKQILILKTFSSHVKRLLRKEIILD
jgi:hypothetical protein